MGIRRFHRDNYQVILDRKHAIITAISMARKGDIVLLAGKGHENYQILNDKMVHFNDKEVAEDFIRKQLVSVPK